MWKITLVSLNVHLHFPVIVCSWHSSIHHLFLHAIHSVHFNIFLFVCCLFCPIMYIHVLYTLFLFSRMCLSSVLLNISPSPAICVSPFISRLCLSFTPSPFVPVLFPYNSLFHNCVIVFRVLISCVAFPPPPPTRIPV